MEDYILWIFLGLNVGETDSQIALSDCSEEVKQESVYIGVFNHKERVV